MASARSRSARSTWRSGTPSPRSRASRSIGCWPTATGDGKPDERVFVYAAGGYYYPGKDLRALQDEMRGYLDLRLHGGQDEDRRRLARRGSAPHRGGARVVGTGQNLAVDANGRFDLRHRHRLRRRRSRRTTCSGTRRRATRSISRCRPSLRSTTRARWRPARTSSRCRTRAT